MTHQRGDSNVGRPNSKALQIELSKDRILSLTESSVMAVAGPHNTARATIANADSHAARRCAAEPL